ncbi:MAG: ABC transporter ATP-binding protein [Hyphomicrobiales bacterium]|nr:ABC transporter ATP-binding protein [Hyphomicrobiales bacterium]
MLGTATERGAAPSIILDDLTLGYDRHPAVHHLSGQIAPGALLAVVGPNGAGKSTLIKGLIGELKPLGGRISGALAGPGRRQVRLAYVPQKDGIDLTYPVSVFDLVAMGLWERRGLFGAFGRSDTRAVAQALALVGLSGFERRPVGTLSGGQLQRALFARVSLQDAPVILLDEPFSAIDNATVDDLMTVIRGWHREGRTVVAVLHDLALVRAHFPQTLLMARQAIAWGPTAQVLTPENLARSRAMTEAFDDTAPFCEVSPDGGHAHPHGHDHDHGHDHSDGHAHGDRHGHAGDKAAVSGSPSGQAKTHPHA